MQDMKRLQAYDSHRCRNNIPFPIPPLAVRHPRNSFHLSGWLELRSPANFLPRSAHAGFHPGILTAGADRELFSGPFLLSALILPGPHWPFLSPPGSLDCVCLYHGRFGEPTQSSPSWSPVSPSSQSQHGFPSSRGRGIVAASLSSGPAFPTYSRSTACTAVSGAVASTSSPGCPGRVCDMEKLKSR